MIPECGWLYQKEKNYKSITYTISILECFVSRRLEKENTEIIFLSCTMSIGREMP